MIYKSLNNLKTKRINKINAAAYHTWTVSYFRKCCMFFLPNFIHNVYIVIVAKSSHRQRIRLTVYRYIDTRVPVNQEIIKKYIVGQSIHFK